MLVLLFVILLLVFFSSILTSFFEFVIAVFGTVSFIAYSVFRLFKRR